jgi:hypothetical protein
LGPVKFGCMEHSPLWKVKETLAAQDTARPFRNPKVQCSFHKGPLIVPIPIWPKPSHYISLTLVLIPSWSRDKVVSIATNVQVGRCGVRLTASKRLFSKSKRADRPRGPPSLLFNGQQTSFLPNKTVGVWSWPPNLHLEQRLRNSGTIALLAVYTFMTWTGKSLTFLILCFPLYLGLPYRPLSKDS